MDRQRKRSAMKTKHHSLARVTQKVFALRHIETGEYICLRQNGREYVACFSEGDAAFQLRDELGLRDHVDVFGAQLGELPFDHYWMDGEMIGKAVLAEETGPAPKRVSFMRSVRSVSRPHPAPFGRGGSSSLLGPGCRRPYWPLTPLPKGAGWGLLTAHRSPTSRTIPVRVGLAPFVGMANNRVYIGVLWVPAEFALDFFAGGRESSGVAGATRGGNGVDLDPDNALGGVNRFLNGRFPCHCRCPGYRRWSRRRSVDIRGRGYGRPPGPSRERNREDRFRRACPNRSRRF